jgi:hypothetical protein
VTARTLRFEEGTKKVGTATVREDMTVGRSFAEREILRRTGAKPNSDFDEIADGAPVKSLAPTAPTRPKAPTAPRASKYGNTKCESSCIKFDSKREMMRWHDLVQMQVRREISDLKLQVPFQLTERKQRDDGTWERASKYIADFTYLLAGKLVVEDVKSVATKKNRTYVQKRKQMLDKYDISVREF